MMAQIMMIKNATAIERPMIAVMPCGMLVGVGYEKPVGPACVLVGAACV